MKRRYLSIVFAFLLILGLLSGCGKKAASAVNESSTKPSVTESVTTAIETSNTSSTVETRVETSGESSSINETETVEDTTEETVEETVKETIIETVEDTIKETTEEFTETDNTISEEGEYSSKEEVALYLHLYGHLPSNYITKKEAEELGWVASKGNLWKVAPGKSIGGDKFGNYEKLLPTAKGRKYTECDIDYDGGKRNAKRIIFSNDGLVYYTEDHYESFELLYGEE